VPLVLGQGRHLKEEPLTSLVLERWFVELNFYHIVGVTDDSSNLCRSASANLTPKTLEEVGATSPEFPSPSEITNAVLPELVTGKW
jgi:hypothetical protein